ncbi:type I restriction endonuclease subunit R [Micromonospora sp. SL1-18]|uniref:type I restriction endonuclease subunit R n=1 Tax=Micromonospora sp. SL1-18 TaxID=3399128 RepID=UPI003A4DAA6C
MNESVVEQAALGWFEWLGFDTQTGANISPGAETPLRGSYEDVVLDKRLQAALRKINADLPEDSIEQAMRVVLRPPEPTLAQNNRWFHRLIIEGVDVEHRTADGEVRGAKAWLVDFDNPDRNDLMVAHQFTVRNGSKTRRADLVVFLNGLPIAVIELKDLTDERTDIWKAYRQLQEYKEDIPLLFAYNEIMVISDGESTRVGSTTADSNWFSPWRTISELHQSNRSHLEVLIKDLFKLGSLLDYLRYCVTFDEDSRTGAIVKKLAAYHQFRAVRRARRSVKAALKPTGDGRGGVVWHTQGSGKSLTMLMLSAALIGDRELGNPTIVVVTDRNDLDDQLFGTFAAGHALLRQPPEKAESREDLAAKLNRASGGVVFTTIQKFQERGAEVSKRHNIVVLADEAHRSQYGFLEGGARWMRNAIPNATFVGFTGTPLERDDRSTPAIFGDYSDTYDIRQAVEDNATVPIYYEMRLVKLLPDEEGIADAERQLRAATDAERQGYSLSEDFAVPLEELIGAAGRLRIVAKEIVEHFEKRREAIEGKAMVVCMNRRICMDLYDQIVALRPQWDSDDDSSGVVKVVMTGSSSEGDRIARHARSKGRRRFLADRFKNPDDDLRLVIVCDMWLTGFDCPPMHTIYLDKPLAGHNLMQAIARVNRVFGEKPGGVVVDFLGIADQLRDAVQTYTQAGGSGAPVASVQDAAVPVMERQYEVLRDFFEGLDYNGFTNGDEAEQLRAVAAGADWVFEQRDGKRRFMGLVAGLSKAFALSVPREEAEAIRDSLAFFQAVRAAIRKRLSDEGPPPETDARAAIRQVIAGAIVSDGVIDLFRAAGIRRPDVGILSEEFLDSLAAMPQQNLALETLRKLLNDQIAGRERVNLVQSRTFREALEGVLVRYNNRALTTAQVVQELISLARAVREAVSRGEESGLTEEEVAFYDALADNESAREVLQQDALRMIARELSDRIKAKASLDWTERETVRADMRRTVRRLLARYGYPPNAQEAATQLVIRQAELMAKAVMVGDKG